jgi:hypothetical protein
MNVTSWTTRQRVDATRCRMPVAAQSSHGTRPDAAQTGQSTWPSRPHVRQWTMPDEQSLHVVHPYPRHVPQDTVPHCPDVTLFPELSYEVTVS